MQKDFWENKYLGVAPETLRFQISPCRVEIFFVLKVCHVGTLERGLDITKPGKIFCIRTTLRKHPKNWFSFTLFIILDFNRFLLSEKSDQDNTFSRVPTWYTFDNKKNSPLQRLICRYLVLKYFFSQKSFCMPID